MADSDTSNRPSHVLEDPSAKAVARVYAAALLDGAQAASIDDPLEEFTSFFDDVLKSNPQLHRLLTSEVTGNNEKLGLIDRIVAPHASEFFTNFLRVLCRHERLDLIELILSESWLEHERRNANNAFRLKVRLHSPTSSWNASRIESSRPFPSTQC